MSRTPSVTEGADAATAVPTVEIRNASAKVTTSRSAVYWQAVRDTSLFAGPLGEVVGEIDAGTVIRELTRFQDPFGGWWIGTKCTADDGDGATGPSAPAACLAWVSYNGSEQVPLEYLGAAEPLWVQVFRVPDEENTKKAARNSVAPPGRPRGETDSGPSHRSRTDTHGKDTRQQPARSSDNGDAPAQQQKPFATLSDRDAMEACLHVVDGADLLAFEKGCSRLGDVGAETVGDELDLIEYYWSDPQLGKERSLSLVSQDWNQLYQDAVEQAYLHSADAGAESQRPALLHLQRLLERFEAECQVTALAVVENMIKGNAVSPTSAPSAVTLRPHREFAQTVFFTQSLLVRLCADTAMGFYGGESGAQKAAQRQFQTTRLLCQTVTRNLLSVPLRALVDFEGYRMTISTIPPLAVPKERSALFRPLQAALDGNLDSPPELVRRLSRGLADSLRVCSHAVDPSQGATTWESALPLEWELHVGRDRRLYVLHASRLMSSADPLARQALRRRDCHVESAAKAVVPLLTSVRPELWLSWKDTVNVDVGVRGCCTAADVRASWQMLDYVKNTATSSCAGMLGMHLPLPPSMKLPTVLCNACQTLIDGDEVRFVVCRNPQRCCHVCANCYTRAIAEHGQTLDQTVFKHAVTCWQSHCGARALSAVCMEPGVTELMHANGLPMRHTAYVYHRLPTSARPFVAHHVEVEVVARAACTLLRAALRGAVTSADAKATVESFLVTLLQSEDRRTERFWAKELGPLLERMFPGFVDPFSTETMSKELLLERVQSLTGLVFSAESRASFSETGRGGQPAGTRGEAQQTPFIELISVSPRVRLSAAASSLSQASGTLSSTAHTAKSSQVPAPQFTDALEALLLFWIGYAPEDAEDVLQPFYLSQLTPT